MVISTSITVRSANGTKASTTTSNTPIHATPGQTFDLTLSASFPWGNYADGPAFILVGAATPNIISRTPAATTLETLAANGAKLNPAVGVAQAYDQRAANEPFTSYGTPTSIPVAVAAGDVFVVCKSSTATVLGDERSGVPDEFGAFFFVSELPLDGELSPYAISEDGRTVIDRYYIDFDAKIAALPSYDTSGFANLPTFSTLYAKLNHFFPILAGDDDITNPFHYRTMMVRGMGSNTNTGKELAIVINNCCLVLISSSYTTAEKKQMAIALCSLGIQCCEPFKKTNTNIFPNGQHMQWHFTPWALALSWMGREADIATYWNISGNYKQAFKFTAAQAADCVPHSDMTKPWSYRRRNISAIAGNVLTVATYQLGEDGDAPNWGLNGMTCTDGTNSSVVVTSSSEDTPTGGAGTINVTLADATGFATSTDCWFIPPFTPAENDYDWRITDAWNHYTPSRTMPYRREQDWEGAVLLLKALNIAPVAFDAVFGYTQRCAEANNPTVGFDYQRLSIPGSLFAPEFWDAHAATIFAP